MFSWLSQLVLFYRHESTFLPTLGYGTQRSERRSRSVRKHNPDVLTTLAKALFEISTNIRVYQYMRSSSFSVACITVV
jgi:hypothetical protein